VAIPKLISLAKGSWQGKSKLNFSEDCEVEKVEESESVLDVQTDRQNTFATLTYTWAYEGQKQEGTLVIAGSERSEAVTGGWVDSWHQGSALMSLRGTGMKADRLSLTGAYAAPGQPDWGWRIELVLVDKALELRMTNVSPTGVEAWAVVAVYMRA
jgi:hypothetical protein